jgi:hypothetical protein
MSRGQQDNFELNKLKFNGLGFSETKELIIKTFGQGKKVETNYECGFFTNDQDGGPYYQLIYTDFNYIGSDKEEFFLQNVNFDIEGKMKMYYQDKVLSGQTTEDDLIKIFGEKAKDNFTRHADRDTIFLYSKDSDDAAVFTFKNGRLHKFDYWTPC